MSRGVYMSTAMRSGSRMGNTTLLDSMVSALTDPFGVGHMGVTAENLAEKWNITREEQDELAAESHRRAAAAIAEGRVIGWFQGRLEWGPRALGNRSILGDPRRADMKDILNLKIKRRESFRPFAPSVLADDAKDWFELAQDSPYMLLVAPVAAAQHVETGDVGDASGIALLHRVRSTIPAVTHVDRSARVQTVDTARGPFEQLFGLANVTVTTASARGPITIDALDVSVAEHTVAWLTERAQLTGGDGT